MKQLPTLSERDMKAEETAVVKTALMTVADEDGNRRADLLRVAARLFREKGFEGTTIRAIADAVGMRSGSPFYHFKSKQEILAAVMEEGLVAGLAETEKIGQSGLAPREKFRALVRSHLQTVLGEGQDFIPVLLYDWRSLTPELQQRIIGLKDRYDAIWQQALADLKQHSLLDSDDKVVRLLLLGAINYTVQWYRPGKGVSLDELTDRVLEIFLRA
ncbi:TetR/AcrR family transcriptional regulator [Massilia sp. W12]|uniref:TetR/AcrR family transcriptional regulator n=1 Tax=Massilia sp. W12 TaxID=3126507 RepID=UPI0030CE8520